MYCFKCKNLTNTHNYGEKISKNGRLMGYGKCSKCGSKKSTFVKQKECKGEGIANNLINNMPFEMHYPGHNFLGPGTKLNKRLNEDLTPKDWSIPIDRDDAIAYRHDLCYAQNKDTKTRNEVCDKQMLKDLKDIVNPTNAERRHINVAKTLIGLKKRFGMGIKKKTFEWTDELAEELHKPVRHKFPKRRVWSKGIDDIWAADLVDMSAFSKDNDGVKFLLTIIDLFSKHGWMIPLKI